MDLPKKTNIDDQGPTLEGASESLVAESSQGPTPKGLNPSKVTNKYLKIGMRVGLALLVLLLVGGLFGAFAGFTLKTPVQATLDTVTKLTEDFQNKDLVAAKQTLETLDNNINTLNSKYKLVGWTKVIPFFGSYTQDGKAPLQLLVP